MQSRAPDFIFVEDILQLKELSWLLFWSIFYRVDLLYRCGSHTKNLEKNDLAIGMGLAIFLFWGIFLNPIRPLVLP